MARTIKRKLPPDFMLTVREYALNRSLRERALVLEEKYKKKLKDTIPDVDHRVIEGGHRVVDLPDGVPLGKKMMIGVMLQRRAPQVLAQDRTEEFLRAKGLWKQCTVTVEVLNEDAILALNFSGEITDVELKALYDENETFAFYPVYE